MSVAIIHMYAYHIKPESNPMPKVPLVALAISQFLSKPQFQTMLEACVGEEGAFFCAKFQEMHDLIQAMPKTYDQDGKGDEAIVTLHYFSGGSDWYITEKDVDGGVEQAFGFAILNGWLDDAELGYISIQELVAHGVQLDLYFTPVPLGTIKRSKGIK